MSSESLDQRFADAMGQCLGPDFPSDIGLAVSGGSDSMAMLALCHNWARVWGVRLWIATIDHGLRAESAEEAAMVADEARLLGHAHCTLRWRWDGQGNLQARARNARLRLLNRWRGFLGHVLFAHTSDDVAETFLLRLAREAGVEGLAEIQRSRQITLPFDAPFDPDEAQGDLPPPGQSASFILHRPCLDMSRAELRHYARTLKVRWVDDPSNDDLRFDRVKMRKALPTLEEAGLSRATLVNAARHMARAAEALRLRAAERFEEIGSEGKFSDAPTGELLFDRTGFERTDRDTQLRLLSKALSYTSSQSYRPREMPLEGLLDRLLSGGAGTLHGCEARMERDVLRVFREFQAVETQIQEVQPGEDAALWDGRFRLSAAPGQALRALGPDGWAQIAEKPDDAPSFQAARSLPSLWDAQNLVACPAMGHGTAQQSLWPMGQEGLDFMQFLLSH